MKKKIVFPENFWTKKRPHATKEDMQDDKPFEWPKEVLEGKIKPIINKAN